jgi:hypothetical protein
MTGTAWWVRRPTRWRAAALALAASAVLSVVTPPRPALADPVRGETRPAQPLSWFPAPVRAACRAWREADWPRHDNWYALGPLGRVRGGRLYPNAGPQLVLPWRAIYHQYDVPGPGYGAANRGRARFVRGSQRGHYRLYYTDDQFVTFREVRPAC